MYLELHKGRRQKKWCFGVWGLWGRGGGWGPTTTFDQKTNTFVFASIWRVIFQKIKWYFDHNWGGGGSYVVGTTQKYHFFDAAPKLRLLF